jgi:catechol 2,3-dioxygenase-like lactoylglutathione lyase family enzyme
MIDHLSLPVSDVNATARAYTQALAPLGYSVLMSFTREQIPQLPHAASVGLGAKGKPDLWLRPSRHQIDGTHIAFAANDRKTVDAFHAAALAAGMTDDGLPGVRQHYHPNYYGAFVKDADGHSLEVVCHSPAVVKAATSAKKSAPAKKKVSAPAKKKAKPAAKKRK